MWQVIVQPHSLDLPPKPHGFSCAFDKPAYDRHRSNIASRAGHVRLRCQTRRCIQGIGESSPCRRWRRLPAATAHRRSTFVLTHAKLFSVWRMRSFHINEKIGCSCAHWCARFRSVGLRSGGTAGSKPGKTGWRASSARSTAPPVSFCCLDTPAVASGGAAFLGGIYNIAPGCGWAALNMVQQRNFNRNAVIDRDLADT